MSDYFGLFQADEEHYRKSNARLLIRISQRAAKIISIFSRKEFEIFLRFLLVTINLGEHLDFWQQALLQRKPRENIIMRGARRSRSAEKTGAREFLYVFGASHGERSIDKVNRSISAPMSVEFGR